MAAVKLAPFVTIFFFFFFFFICFAVFHIRADDCRKPSKRRPFLFIFGDSLFDAGNNNYINTSTLDKANFWPYGVTYFHYPTGRFSDGRLISDFIAEKVKVPLIPPYLQPRRKENIINIYDYHGVNFASAGAGVLSSTFQGMVINLRTQVKYYTKEMIELRARMGNVEASRISSKAVYLFSIGTNDYISPFLLNSTLFESYSHTQYVEIVIGNLSTIVKEIYARGGRKFVFLDLGELGCFPGLRILVREETAEECLREPTQLAKLHNVALEKMLSNMARKLRGFEYFLFDFNSSLAEKYAQPAKYGFEESKKACCGSGRFNGVFSCGGKRPVEEFELCDDPSNFVYWDSYHLTEKANEQIAQEMWTAKASDSHGLKRLFE